jgi:peptide/nickel transport system ATP-binding protein
MTLLAIEDLSVDFAEGQALRRVSLTLGTGERLGIVGESGSGKSLLARSVLGLWPEAARVSGRVVLDGADMVALPEAARARLRGRHAAMVFQDPMAALDPLQRIGTQIAEGILWHEGGSRAAAWSRAAALLAEVGLPDPEARLRQYPHELSGGQRQRALIALALACDPALLLADEPTTALDAVVALRVLDLLRDLAQRRGMALVLVSHDLRAVARVAERVVVLYGGEVMETGPVDAVFADPRHPYTRGLMEARPTVRPPGAARAALPTIPGHPPSLGTLPPGCRFYGRCPISIPACADPVPLVPLGDGRAARCVHVLP